MPETLNPDEPKQIKVRAPLDIRRWLRDLSHTTGESQNRIAIRALRNEMERTRTPAQAGVGDSPS